MCAPLRGAPKVFATRQLPGEALARLAAVTELEVWPGDDPPSPAELLERASAAEGLLTLLTDRVDEGLLAACPELRVVSNMAVGVDNLDLVALTARGIPVGHTPGVLTDATADLTFALILAVARRLVEGREAILAGEWTTWRPSGWLGLELAGATLGIVGTGRIGQAVARRALGFNLRLLGFSRSQPEIEAMTYVPLEELLSASDIVTLHVALNPETRHLIGARELALMKPGAILVNTARGPIVDQPALRDALASGRLGGAGLDVFEEEPVSPDEPLLRMRNCIAIPHLGSATAKTRSAMADRAVDNLLAGLAGQPMPYCANPEVYSGR
jgi:lactate dehydrogenase-like 2-hydroxyacid dehydrogenase